MTTELTFAGLVRMHQQNIQSGLRKTLDGAANAPWCDWVLWIKVDKHIRNGDFRKAAFYIKERLESFSEPLSKWLQTQENLASRRDPDQVLYRNDKGEWRAFHFVRKV